MQSKWNLQGINSGTYKTLKTLDKAGPQEYSLQHYLNTINATRYAKEGESASQISLEITADDTFWKLHSASNQIQDPAAQQKIEVLKFI